MNSIDTPLVEQPEDAQTPTDQKESGKRARRAGAGWHPKGIKSKPGPRREKIPPISTDGEKSDGGDGSVGFGVGGIGVGWWRQWQST